MEPPAANTRERAAWDYLTSEQLAVKLAPPADTEPFETPPLPRRIEAPGRPPELRVVARGLRTPSVEAMRGAEARAKLVHTFLHHEVQAAELMCWALLAYPDTPQSFRRGLLVICADEVRHMLLYRDYLLELGYDYGAFPVRDWFWQRVPQCLTATHFVATLGIGLEGANLDHTQRFAARFREVGDERGAQLQEQVGEEEVGHVRFAMNWFRRWAGDDSFESWAAHLPPPLSPTLMRWLPINRDARGRAGLSEAFVDALERWEKR